MPRSSARSARLGHDSDRTASDETHTRAQCVEQVAHDLRSPVCAVRGFAYLLEQEVGARLGKQGLAYLERVQRGIERVGTLIEGLADASRAVRSVPARQWIAVEPVLRSIATELKTDIERRGVELRLPSEPPPVFAEAERFHEIALHLICSALQRAGESAGRRVEVLVREGPSCRELVVHDDGRSTTGGDDLGLLIVRRILQAHGGTLEILAAPSTDTTAICRFPDPETA